MVFLNAVTYDHFNIWTRNDLLFIIDLLLTVSVSSVLKHRTLLYQIEYFTRFPLQQLPVMEFEPQPKKAKVQEEPEVKIIGNEEVMIIKDDTQKKVPAGKEAAIEAEVAAARERAVVPLDVRMKQFRELLEDKQISAFSTWEKELHKIVFDPR